MKKNFFKKLSFVLAFAMVATTVAPVGTASAAAKTPNLAKRYANVYEGTSYSYGVKDAAGYTVKWAVSGKGASYASLSKASGTKTVLKINTKGAAAAKNAPVVVTAKFYKGKKLVKSAGDAVTVKVSATAVDIVTKADPTKIAAGEAVKFSRKITPANATSVTYWSVTDKDGKETTNATIDKTGNFTATELGDYVIVAETKNAKNGKVIAKDTQEVKVVLAITSAAQQTVKKLDVNFNAKLPDTIKATDFSIVKDSTSQSIAVSEIKVDGKKVTVSTYQKLNDGASYTVKYGDSSASFVASDNKVASVVISPATIPNNKLTKIKVATQDANGVELDSYDYGKQDSNIDFSIETTEGYTSDTDLLLYDIGDTAKAKATYHTYKYDDKGNETGAVSTELTITAVDQSTAIDAYKYTIDDDTPDWDDTKINTKLAVEDYTYEVYFTAQDANDEDLTDFKLVSSDPDMILVGDTSVTTSQGQSDNDTLVASIAAVGEGTGTAYVLVQNDDGNTILSLPVAVVAKRKATSMTLSTYNVELSNSGTVTDSKEVDVETFDQFGEELEGSTDDVIDVECTDAPNGVVKQTYSAPVNNTTLKIDSASDKVTFFGSGLTAGTYKYKIKAGGDEKITRTITIKVTAPDTINKAPTYKLVITDGVVDTKITKLADNNKTLSIKLAEYRGTVVNNYVDLTPGNGVTVSITEPDGDAVPGSVAAATTDGVYQLNQYDATFYARFVDTIGGNAYAGKADNGVYTVKFAVDADVANLTGITSDIEFKGSFTVKDTQASAAVTKDKDNTDIANSFVGAIKDCFNFWYDGDEDTNPTITDYTIISPFGEIEATDLPAPTPSAGTTYSLKDVTFVIPVVDGGTTVFVPVTVTLLNNNTRAFKINN